MLRRPPIRTYERKNRLPLSSRIYPPNRFDFTAEEDISSFKGWDNEKKNSTDKSLDYDPFDTTFDRIAKDAKVPTPPVSNELYEDTTWQSSSYDISNDKSSNCISPFGISTNLPKISTESVQKNKDNITQSPQTQTTKYTLRRRRKNTSVDKQVLKKNKRNISLKILRKGKTDGAGKKKKARKIQSKRRIELNNISSSASITETHSDVRSSPTSQHNDLKLEITNQLNISPEIKTLEWRAHDDIKTKPCSVILDNLSVEQWKERKKSLNNGVDVHSVHLETSQKGLFLDKSSEDSSYSDTNVRPSTTDHINFKRKKINAAEHCHIKLSRLQSLNAKVSGIGEGPNNVICSTPMGKPIRPSSYLIPISPINDKDKLMIQLDIQDKSIYINDASSANLVNILIEKDPVIKQNTFTLPDLVCDTEKLNLKNYCENQKIRISDQSMLYLGAITKTDVPSSKKSNSHSPLSPTLLPTQILLSSQKEANDDCVRPQINNIVDTLQTALTQKYVKPDVKDEKTVNMLNISSETDRSRSLFEDISAIIEPSLQVSMVVDKTQQGFLNSQFETRTENVQVTMKSERRSIESPNFSSNNFVSDIDKNPSNNKEDMSDVLTFEDSNALVSHNLEEIIKSNDIEQQHIVSNDFTNEKIADVTNESMNNESRLSEVKKDDSHAIEPYVLLTRLQDPIRITERRKRYCKWDLNLSNIFETHGMPQECQSSLNKEKEEKNINVNIKKIKNQNKPEPSCKSSKIHLLESNEILPSRKSLFLKPGKSWTRSLSILNNIQSDADLDRLSIGKGKKWRCSVQNILEMQEQGVIQSCVKKKSSNNQHESCAVVYNKSQNISINNETHNVTSLIRISKRISIRVVPNNDSTKKIDDTPFLQVYGIAATKTPKSTLRYSRRTSLYHNELSNFDTQTIECHATAKNAVLQRCEQQNYMPFLEYFPESYLHKCQKIGEGVYGEVFLYEHEEQKSVIKIIPIEGKELVNGEPQKKFAEILSEIVIAKELHNLRFNQTYNTSGFVAVKNIKCLIGKYPEKLIELWNRYDEEKNSDNDSPAMFDENQLYIVLELTHGGQDLEAFVFNTADQAYTLFIQAALALAVAEKALEFEHRDLHWGNVLISTTNEPYVHYNLDSKNITCSTNGVKISIIDFTLSRMSYQGCCIFNDLSSDPALFTAQGEYQFEIYRLMQDRTKNDWQRFEPYTNVLWLHYTLDKMITAVRYKKKTIKGHKNAIVKLKELKDIMLTYDSAFDFVSNCSVFKNLGSNNFVVESLNAVPRPEVDVTNKLLLRHA